MHQEGVTEEDITGAAGGPGGGPVRAGPRGLLGGGEPGHAVVAAGDQDRRDVEVGAGAKPGGCVVRADVGEQVERQQATAAGLEADARAPVVAVAGFDVPAGVAWVVRAGEPDRDRAAHSGVAGPAAGAEQLVAGLAHQPGGAGRGERGAAGRVDPEHRAGPGGRVVAEQAVRGQFGPDDVLAGPGHVGRDRVADGDVAVGDEAADLVRAEHEARIASGRVGSPADLDVAVTMGKRRILR